MALRLFHRILITAAIALGALLVLYTGYRWLALGDGHLLPAGVLGGAFAIGLGLYLRWFLNKRLRPR